MQQPTSETFTTPYFDIWKVIGADESVLQTFKTQSEALAYAANESNGAIISIDARTCTIKLIERSQPSPG
jgi:hypothetical protein